MIRSNLASFESLELNLIPSIFSYCNDHSEILINHWKYESKNLLREIHKIIDTHAFCECLLEKLSNEIDKLAKNFNKNDLDDQLIQCEIFFTHLIINTETLKLNTDPDLKLHFNRIKLMIHECRAAFEFIDAIECSRIIKRTKILYATIRKFQKCLKIKDAPESQIFSNFSSSIHQDISSDTPRDIAAVKEDYFDNFGIKPSICSILYKSARQKKSTESLIPRTSKLLTSRQNSSLCNATFRSKKKR